MQEKTPTIEFSPMKPCYWCGKRTTRKDSEGVHCCKSCGKDAESLSYDDFIKKHPRPHHEPEGDPSL